jgi:hypothetical protein
VPYWGLDPYKAFFNLFFRYKKNIRNSIIKIPKVELDLQPSYIATKATSLLAEVEQELEAERFSQKNLDETERLLAQARAKLSNKTDRELMTTITAESLLAEVDLQDNASLRDKIWKLIEVNFKELKTSLGTR